MKNRTTPDRPSTPTRVLTIVVLILVSRVCAAQLPQAVSPDTRVSLVTVMPGDPVYTMFGHSAIRFVDPVSRLDASFNYGTFDFDGTFVFRFASGRLDYRLDVTPTAPTLRYYASENRTVIEQVLDLDAPSVAALYELLRINYQPENRYYRYDFFFDNCSTRIRDVLEAATQSTVRAVPADAATYRDLLKPYIGDRPLLAALMNIGLGAGADRPAPPRDHAFLPEVLMLQLEATTRADGRPMVSSTDTLYVAGTSRPSRMPVAVGIAWAFVALVVVVTTIRQVKGRPRVRWVDVTLMAGVGLAGLLLAYLWFGSDHVVAANNLNLLWAFPGHLLVAPMLTKRHLPTWTRIYFAIAIASILVLLCGLSWWQQEVHALAIPIAVLIAVRCGRCLLSATNRPA